MSKVRIRKCGVAPGDPSVDKPQLLLSSGTHIREVRELLDKVVTQVKLAGIRHDKDKISEIDVFHRDLLSNFERGDWFPAHSKRSRHHFSRPDYIPEDVNLIDVLEYLSDGICAGLSRSGRYEPADLSPQFLLRAFQNTEKLLLEMCEMESETEPDPDFIRR